MSLAHAKPAASGLSRHKPGAEQIKRLITSLACLAALAGCWIFWPKGSFLQSLAGLLTHSLISLAVVGAATILALVLPFLLAMFSYLGCSSHFFRMTSPGGFVKILGRMSQAASSLIFIVNIIPIFFLATLVSGLAPGGAWGEQWHMGKALWAYGIIVLGLCLSNMIWTMQYRVYMTSLLQVEASDYLKTALVKGYDPRIIRRYFKPTVLQVMAKSVKPVFSSLLGMAIFFEYAVLLYGPAKGYPGGLSYVLFLTVKNAAQWDLIYLTAILAMTALVMQLLDLLAGWWMERG